MKLKKLISGLPIEIYRSGKDIEITGLCSHSKLVCPGDLFIAKKGGSEDGSKYIEEAIESGAVAILTDHPNPFLKETVQLIHPDVKSIEGALASAFYEAPSKSLFMVGVTGTKGKTSTTYLIKHLFDSFEISCGLIGTIEYIVGDHHFESERTTPDVITNQKLLREMKKRGCQAAVMEVSSHGLAQGRVNQIDFDVAIFTNLSQDHLDYHHSMEAYAQEKAKLFTNLGEDKLAVVNYDSTWTSIMVKKCKARILTFGFTEGADIYAHSINLGAEKTSFLVTFQGETVVCNWSHIGRFNISNALAAIGALLGRGFSLLEISKKLSAFEKVPGRLEKVENLAGLNIFVDYAHAPDALEKVLVSMKEFKKGRLLCVFGCGGDRDRGKRPIMGHIANTHADFTWVTSDNPRSENPLSICHAIAEGFTSPNYLIEPDRSTAIGLAIASATPDDLIIIAGKGHETYQIFSHQTIPFDDKKVAQEKANMSLYVAR